MTLRKERKNAGKTECCFKESEPGKVMKLMKSRNIIESFNHAINGIIHAVKSERNMKIHIAFGIAVFC